MSYRLGVDVGGTFTDVLLINELSGEFHTAKVPSTPQDSSLGVLHGIERVCAKAGINPHDITQVMHGTTVATNALLERKVAKTGVIHTRGFRDVLEIARGNRALPYQMHYRKADPLVSRERRYELTERMSAQGESLSAPDLAELKALASQWQQQGVESIAISFLNAYANPAH